MTAGADERALSDRLARGDRGALAQLHERYAAMLLGVATRLMRDRAEAEEVVQETFLEAWRRAEQYQPERANVAAWLLTITRSRAIDRLRSKGTTDRTLELEGRSVPLAPGQPDELYDLARLNLQVRRRVAELPVEQRSLLELAWDEGLSQRQIAVRTGLPLGTVKTRTRAALQTLHADFATRR